MDVNIEFKGLKEVIANLDDLAKKQVPYALSRALNQTAEDVKAAELKLLQSSVKGGPTRWTMNSLFIARATKTYPVATIGYKDKSSIRVTTTNKGQGTPAAYYLAPNVEGGQRNLKGFELALQRKVGGILPQGMYIVPGAGCPLDAHGNIPSKFIYQIMSYFSLAEKSIGYTANIHYEKKYKMKVGTKKKRGFEYIISLGKGTMINTPTKSGGVKSVPQHLAAGIYKKEGWAWGSRIIPIFMFVKKPFYSPRFPFYSVAQKVIDQKIKPNFDEAMREALLTARRTGN